MASHFEEMKTRQLSAHETPSMLSRNGYNVAAQQYLDWTSSQPSPRLEWLEKLLSYLAKSGEQSIAQAKVLELGCGAGVPCTLKIAQTCGHVFGVDISSTQIDMARKRFKDARVPQDKYELGEADMTKLTFPEQSLNAICAFYSIIQLSLADQKALFERMYDWLMPDGLVLFNVAEQATPERGEVMDGWLGMTAFWAGYGTDKSLEILQNSGFGVLESETIHIEGDAPFTWIIARKKPKDHEQ